MAIDGWVVPLQGRSEPRCNFRARSNFAFEMIGGVGTANPVDRNRKPCTIRFDRQAAARKMDGGHHNPRPVAKHSASSHAPPLG